MAEQKPGELGGDYARDTHREGLGDDYARDGGFSGGGGHADHVRDPHDDEEEHTDDAVHIGKASE